jgi:hypothetical protein
MKTNFISLVHDLALILRGGATYINHSRHTGAWIEYQKAPARDWHAQLQIKYKLHPAVEKALESDHRPYDWHLLVLEWPHISETDSTRLAYTRDERAGFADRQTVTTLGKYLVRHFPSMPDHEVRDLVALYSAGDSCKLVYTMAEMLYHLQQGPTSCMGGGKSFDIMCADGVRRHPYQVYDPKFGWHMAVRMQNGDTDGRALCMTDGDTKYFVRSYRKNGSGYSHADEQLEAWLVSQGYEKQSSWDDGDKLAKYPVNGGEILAPYIDGNNQRVSDYSDHLRIDSSGEYDCSQTGGVVGDEDSASCEDCGDRFPEDDGYWVGVHEETHICSSCCDNEYQYVYGRRQNRYYVQNIYTVEVNGEYYDEAYLSDNNIVCLEDGEHAELDDCVSINDDWYLNDDERICYAEDIEEYALKDDCWQCEESNNWYTDATESVEVDGKLYHPDNAPEQETTEE